MEAIVVHDFYFVQKRDVIGLLGLSSIHKCTIAIRMLAYDAIAHYVNKDCRLNESIAFECLKRFVKAIQACFESNYLKQPTLVDVKKQKKINKKKKISKHVCFNRLYAFVLDNLPIDMARSISGQKQDNRHHP
jgi:hypothetical protein